jgi:hypothetical protein
MGPLLLVAAAAAFALGGCATFRKSGTSSEPTPPPPPEPPNCPDSFYGGPFGIPELFPCHRRSEWRQAFHFVSPMNGWQGSPEHRRYLSSIQEYAKQQDLDPLKVIEVADQLQPSGQNPGLSPQEKTHALALAVTLLAAQKTRPGFFINSYRNLLEEVATRIQERGLEIRSAKMETAYSAYSIQEDILNFPLSFPDSFSSEVRQEILGSLFDYYHDGRRTSDTKLNHAFLRYTMLALYHLESSGNDLGVMTREQIDVFNEKELKTQKNGELKAIALRAFYYSIKDATQRFEQMKPFPALYETEMIWEYFKTSYAQARTKSPYHQSWDEILDENRKIKPPNPAKLQADIRKLEKARQDQLAEFKREFAAAETLRAAENKKTNVLLRVKTATELKAERKVRKRFQALVQTWSNLILLQNLQQNSNYILAEMARTSRRTSWSAL